MKIKFSLSNRQTSVEEISFVVHIKNDKGTQKLKSFQKIMDEYKITSFVQSLEDKYYLQKFICSN